MRTIIIGAGDVGFHLASRLSQQGEEIVVIDLDQEFSLAQYLEQAGAALEDVWSRGKQPLLVGGSGQYVWALLEGWRVPRLPPQRELRRELGERADRQGAEALHRELAQVDPKAAARIDPRNVRRVIRALEVHHQTGIPISRLQRKRPPGYALLKIGLTMPRPGLYRRIDARIDRMIEQGLEAEVRRLLSRGYDYDLPSMSALGYQEIGQYLRGQLSLEEAVALIKRNTRRLVRKQHNWFQLTDKSIHWFDCRSLQEASLRELVRAFMGDG